MANNTVNRITVPRRHVSTGLGRHWMTVWKRGASQDTFERVDIDSGVVLETAPVYVFDDGISSRTPAAPASVPVAERFGHSDSCPVLSVPPTLTVPHALICCCECECGGGSDKPLPSAKGAVLDPVSEEWERFCDGGGVVPSASDPTDAESWL